MDILNATEERGGPPGQMPAPPTHTHTIRDTKCPDQPQRVLSPKGQAVGFRQLVLTGYKLRCCFVLSPPPPPVTLKPAAHTMRLCLTPAVFGVGPVLSSQLWGCGADSFSSTYGDTFRKQCLQEAGVRWLQPGKCQEVTLAPSEHTLACSS